MSALIVHEWLEPTGGAEKVVQEMLNTYRDARLLTLWNDGNLNIDSDKVDETWLARTPLRKSKPLAMPFMIPTWRRQRLNGAEWALISSHLFAHHVQFVDGLPETEKFVYAHTPARYIWEPELDARGNSIFARGIASIVKPIDKRRAAEGSHFAANSSFVRDRIRTTWDQDARIIYPPVRVREIQSVASWTAELNSQDELRLNELPDTFILAASRFVPYKRLDTAIDLGQATDTPVVIAGSGPDEPRLRAKAAESSVPVYFVGRPSDELLFSLYERALVFVFMPIEDFGIMPVEAMAVGTPVIGCGRGGVAETVCEGISGTHLRNSSISSMKEALEGATSINRSKIREHAAKFDSSVFRRNLVSWTGRIPEDVTTS